MQCTKYVGSFSRPWNLAVVVAATVVDRSFATLTGYLRVQQTNLPIQVAY